MMKIQHTLSACDDRLNLGRIQSKNEKIVM